MTTQNSEKSTQNESWQSYLEKLEKTLEDLFKKAPALPDGVKEFIVTVAPWVTLVLMVLMLPAILAMLGVGTFLAPLAMVSGASIGIQSILSMILSVVIIVLGIMALPGMFKRERKSWQLMFYSSLVSLLQSAVALQIASLIIGGIVSFYILFQLKEKYKN